MLATKPNACGEHFDDGLLRTLRRLGGSVGVSYCCHGDVTGDIREVQTVFVSCPREAWVRAFGEPQQLRPHFDATSGKWIQCWEHPLPTGVLHCVGQIFKRPPGDDWVVVKQLIASSASRSFPLPACRTTSPRRDRS
jgi:hypothetical protein